MNVSRILVVDDEADIRRLLQEILSEEGHDVDVAADAAQARAARARSAPDLVLLDIWMPDTDGITLLREWSSDARHDCPVVMMSGHGTVETAVEATRLGAFDFIEKPLSLAKLLPTVKRALDARRTRQVGGHACRACAGAAPWTQPRRAAAAQRTAAACHVSGAAAADRGTRQRDRGAGALRPHFRPARQRSVRQLQSARLQDDQAVDALLGSNGQAGLLEQASGGTLFLGDIEELPESAHRLLTGVLEGGELPAWWPAA